MEIDINKVKRFYIDKEFANAVLDYLKNRPFIEVYQIIPGFQHLEPVIEKEDNDSI
jgi:hypothetical protein